MTTLNLEFRFQWWVRPAIVVLGWLVLHRFLSEDRAVLWAARIGRWAGLRMVR